MQTYPWHQKQWQQVTSAIAEDKLAHALLLKGESGLGKLDFAKALAKQLLCHTQNHCNACQACHWFESESHPDYRALIALDDNIKVDDIRALMPFLQQTSHSEGGVKIVLIALAENMNQAAANALLKALEEPSDRTYFLLVSENTWHLPATIKSRCGWIDFAISDNLPIINWLVQQGYNETFAKEALQLANNKPMMALSLLQDDTYLENYQVRLNDINALVSDKHFDGVIHKRWQAVGLPLILDELSTLVSALVQNTYAPQPLLAKLNMPAAVHSSVQSHPQKWHERYKNLIEIRRLLGKGYNLNKVLVIDQVIQEFL